MRIGVKAMLSGRRSRLRILLSKHAIAPESICDIGCGTGGVLDSLRAMLPRTPAVTGYEVAKQALDLAPADRREQVELINGSCDSDDRTFDLLLALDVFEHLEDYYGFLRGIRTKAPLAMFHIPIDTALTSVLRPGPILNSYRKVGHIQHYTRTLAIEALRHVGYEIIDAEHTVPARRMHPTGVRQHIGRAARLALARVNVDLAAPFVPDFRSLFLPRPDRASTSPGYSCGVRCGSFGPVLIFGVRGLRAGTGDGLACVCQVLRVLIIEIGDGV